MTVDYYKVLCRMVDKGLTTVEEVRAVVKEIKAESPSLGEAERLCEYLNSGICANGWIAFTLTEATVNEMNELLSEHPAELIKKVIDWALKDDFWSMNVLNPAKLRKHFQVLAAKAERASKAIELASAPRVPSPVFALVDQMRAESVPKPAHIDLKAAVRSVPITDVEVE